MQSVQTHVLVFFVAAISTGCADDLDITETQKRACTVAVDGSWSVTADGAVDVEHRSRFDAEGRLARTDHFVTAAVTDTETTVYKSSYTDYFYDEEGMLIREEDWYVGRLEPFDIKLYSYDEEGRILRFEADFDADGVPQRFAEYVYGEHGLVGETNVSFSHETRFVHKYDESGSRVGEDFYVNGSLDSTAEYTLDGQGRIMTAIREYFREEPLLSLASYQYNERGDIELFQVDSGADGSIDSTIEYRYDEDGNLVSIETDCDMDGVIDWLDSYAYDDAGRVIFSSKQVEEHEMGVVIEKTYDYSCHDI